MSGSFHSLPPCNPDGFLAPRQDWEAGPVAWLESPFLIPLEQFVERFAFNEKRRQILDGFLAHRMDLRAEGFETGFQWIGGSFVEDVEGLEGRNPNDIDVVSFLRCPPAITDPLAIEAFFEGQMARHDRKLVKQNRLCDSFLVPFPPRRFQWSLDAIATPIIHWMNLLGSHRKTLKWKGLIQIDFETTDDDRAARTALLQAASRSGKSPLCP